MEIQKSGPNESYEVTRLLRTMIIVGESETNSPLAQVYPKPRITPENFITQSEREQQL